MCKLSRNEKLGFIMILFLRFLFYLCLMPYTISGDSNEYINVSSYNIIRGNLDMRRVPVYPLMLDMVRQVFSTGGGGRLSLYSGSNTNYCFMYCCPLFL